MAEAVEYLSKVRSRLMMNDKNNGDNVEIEVLARKSIRIMEAFFGHDQPFTKVTLANLSDVLRYDGNESLDERKVLMERYLAITVKGKSVDSNNIAFI